MKIRIAVPVVANSIVGAVDQIRRAEKAGADIVEARLDYLQEACDLATLRDATTIPMIATKMRTHKTSGSTEDDENKIKLLLEAARTGFDYVDVEFCTPNIREVTRALTDEGAKPIVSYHDMMETPDRSTLVNMFRQESNVGAALCKVVTKANRIQDNLVVLSALQTVASKMKVIAFAMGLAGVASRVLSPIFGAYLTFASIEKGYESAPGQLTIRDMKEIYRLMGYARLEHQ